MCDLLNYITFHVQDEGIPRGETGGSDVEIGTLHPADHRHLRVDVTHITAGPGGIRGRRGDEHDVQVSPCVRSVDGCSETCYSS
jgi:hypothetical protein